ncbi:hypothetical protein AAMO2058_001568800 [Amorphochlora amoebiformis]
MGSPLANPELIALFLVIIFAAGGYSSIWRESVLMGGTSEWGGVWGGRGYVARSRSRSVGRGAGNSRSNGYLRGTRRRRGVGRVGCDSIHPIMNYPNGVPFEVLKSLVKRGIQDNMWADVIHRHPDTTNQFLQKIQELKEQKRQSVDDCRDMYMTPEFEWKNVGETEASVFISLNLFPYHFEEDMKLSEFEEVALRKFPTGHDMVLWINDMSMRSVPEILHAHLLVRRQSHNGHHHLVTDKPSRVVAKARMTN